MSWLDPIDDTDGDSAAQVSNLNQAQRDVLDALGARPDERPAFDPRLRHELRAALDDRLGSVAAALPDDETLWLSKHAISSVLGCEGKYLAEEELPFGWTTATARGVVSHKAIELSVHWRGEPAPGVLVDEALAVLINSNDGVSPYLGRLTEAERAELRSGATERVTMFVECFPPMEARWRPVTEARLRADLCNDRVVLRGKVDLTVGRADGVRAGKVLLDLKTGGFAPAHREDLRFYALLETLRLGTPPRSVASYYLDGGRLQVEAVSEAMLLAAVERTVGAAETILSLRTGDRAPVLKPGAPCRWCPALPTCSTGQGHLGDREDREGW